jgi:hypothetical protein
MKNWIVAVVVMAALAIPAIGGAHEGHLHKALGTIASVQGEHVEIKTNDGKSITVMLDTKTTVTRGKDKLDATALKVGDRVSVEYMEEKKMMMAHSIKLGTTTQAAKK